MAVDARWGRYERVPNDQHDIVEDPQEPGKTGQEEEVKVRVWQRIPCGGVASTVPLVDGQMKPLMRQIAVSQKSAYRARYERTTEGERLVTLFLVNGQLGADDTTRTAPGCSSPRFPSTALGRPDGDRFGISDAARPNEIVVDDPERDRLALLYRNRLEFAVGHGVSAHVGYGARGPDEGPSRAELELIPALRSRRDRNTRIGSRGPAPRCGAWSIEGWLDMVGLAEMEPKALREVLSCLDRRLRRVDRRTENAFGNRDQPASTIRVGTCIAAL